MWLEVLNLDGGETFGETKLGQEEHQQPGHPLRSQSSCQQCNKQAQTTI